MSKEIIQKDIEVIRNETEMYGNTRERVASVLTKLNNEKLDAESMPTNIATIDEKGKVGTTYTKEQADTSFIKKPTSTITQPNTSFKYALLLDEEGNSTKMLAGDLGKNLANSKPNNTPNSGINLVTPWYLDTNGIPLFIRGLPDKSNDATFNKMRVQDANGQEAWSNGKNFALSIPSLLSEAEKTAFKTEMNGGFTVNSMSVAIILPMVVKLENAPTYILVKGTGLNFNPNSFKVEIMDEAESRVIATVPNNQVQLNQNGTDLIFYYNFSSIGAGRYKLRLSNGVATYTSGISFLVKDTVSFIDLNSTSFEVKTRNDIRNKFTQVSNTGVIYKADADVYPFGSSGDFPLLSAMKQTGLTMNDDFVIMMTTGSSGADTGNGNVFRIGITNSSINALNADLIGGLAYLTAASHNDINGGGSVTSVLNTLSNIILMKQGTILTTIINGSNGRMVSSNISVIKNSSPVNVKGLFSNISNGDRASVSLNVILAYKF